MKITPLVRAGVVLGLGFGGFFDGIVLHQILGWHHLICRTDTCQPLSIEALQRQNFEDGLFHLGIWVLSLVGTGLLFCSKNQGTAMSLLGAMFAGWGWFNFVEGHQILGIHHVLPGSVHERIYDLAFLGSGLLFIAVGFFLVRRDHAQALAPGSRPGYPSPPHA